MWIFNVINVLKFHQKDGDRKDKLNVSQKHELDITLKRALPLLSLLSGPVLVVKMGLPVIAVSRPPWLGGDVRFKKGLVVPVIAVRPGFGVDGGICCQATLTWW